MNEIKKLLKGKWKYNLNEGKLLCQNTKEGLIYIFENKNNILFQDVLATLEKRGIPNPNLKVDYEEPTTEISLEDLHRVLRSNELLYEQIVELKQNKKGLFCSSKHTVDFELNHHKYPEDRSVYIDPQQVCKITRKIRNRERIRTAIRLEKKRIILKCVFPWVVLTIIAPTLRV